jgi:hypothetical protein
MDAKDLIVGHKYKSDIKLFEGPVNLACLDGEILTYNKKEPGHAFGDSFEFIRGTDPNTFEGTARLSALQVKHLVEL